MRSDGESFRPDIESTILRVTMYLLVLNAPFLGLFKALALGTLEAEYQPFLGVGLACLAASLFIARRFSGIRFGWNEAGVFKQGIFRYTDIKWSEITKIYETGIAQEWTEGDMLFIRKKTTGKKLFVVQSKEKKIVLEFYRPMIGLKTRIAERLGLKVGNEYSAAWDFVVNG